MKKTLSGVRIVKTGNGKGIIMAHCSIDKEERVCAYCEHAIQSILPDTFICRKKGIVSGSGHCLRYLYDPQKRTVRPRNSGNR